MFLLHSLLFSPLQKLPNSNFQTLSHQTARRWPGPGQRPRQRRRRGRQKKRRRQPPGRPRERRRPRRRPRSGQMQRGRRQRRPRRRRPPPRRLRRAPRRARPRPGGPGRTGRRRGGSWWLGFFCFPVLFLMVRRRNSKKKKKNAVSKRRVERAQSMSSGAAATTKNRKRGPQRSINWPCLLATSSGTAERVRTVALGLVVKGSTGSSSRKERTVKRGKSRVDGRRALKEQDDSTSTAPRGFVASQAFRLSRQRADQETDSHAMHRERTRLDGGRERLRPTF